MKKMWKNVKNKKQTKKPQDEWMHKNAQTIRLQRSRNDSASQSPAVYVDNGVQPKLKDNKTCTVSINVIKVMLVS